MASEFYGFFDSVGDDEREYDASQFGKLLRAMCYSGACTGLTVSPTGTGMGVTVAPGSCILNGYLYELRDDGGAAKTLTLQASGAVNRYDRIVAHLDTETRAIGLRVLAGTAGASPEPPALTRTATAYEISLCKVLVQANATLLAAADITDERGDESVCGWAVPEPLRQANIVVPASRVTLAGGGSAQAALEAHASALNADAAALQTVVRHTAQTLTAEQQTQARSNIGLGTAALKGVSNALTQTADGYVLDARQGKALSDAIAAKAAPATDTSATLTAAGWTGTAAPYTQTVAVADLSATAKLTVGLAATITAEQYEAAAAAMLLATAQAAGSVTVSAFGEKPTVDVPIVLREVS